MAEHQPSEEVKSDGCRMHHILANGQKLTQTEPTPVVHVNGEAQEANFKNNYVAPEDEVADDEEHDEVTLGQEARVTVGETSKAKKKSKKKKPKSKRGLVRFCTAHNRIDD